MLNTHIFLSAIFIAMTGSVANVTLPLATLPASAMIFSFSVEEVNGRGRKVSRWAFSEKYRPSSCFLVSAVQLDLSRHRI